MEALGGAEDSADILSLLVNFEAEQELSGEAPESHGRHEYRGRPVAILNKACQIGPRMVPSENRMLAGDGSITSDGFPALNETSLRTVRGRVSVRCNPLFLRCPSVGPIWDVRVRVDVGRGRCLRRRAGRPR